MSENRMGWTPAWMLGGVLVVCMGVVWAKTEQAPPPPPPPPPSPPAVRTAKDIKPPKPPKPPVPPDAPPPPPPPTRAGSDIPGGVFAVAVDSAPADMEATAQSIRLQAEAAASDRQKQALVADRLQMEAEMKKATLDLELAREKEIERRMRYAEERFSKDGVNGILTDRGRAYLKMGPPDEIESHPGKRDLWLYRNGNRIRILEFDGAGKRTQ